MNKLKKICKKVYYTFFIFIVFSSCKKKIIEKEILIDKSKVISQQYFQNTKYFINNGLNLKKYIYEVKDSVFIDSCDLNFDGLMDITFGYELKNLNSIDSLVLESFIEKQNSDFEFLFEESDNINYLTPFYDTNNYISPSSILWKYQTNVKKYRLCLNLLEECNLDNIPQLCLKNSSGFYSPPNQSFEGFYYQGFRFKNKSNRDNWNYGYFIISYSALSFEIYAIAYESYPNIPIGLRKVF